MATPDTSRLEFVTPERLIVHDDVDEVEIPGAEGLFRRAAGPRAAARALTTGEMWYRKGIEQDLHLARRRLRRSPAGPGLDPRAGRRAGRGHRRRPRRGRAKRAKERSGREPASDIDYERARIALSSR